jgi:hypothetical protein
VTVDPLRRRSELRAGCGRCAALCCIAPAFTRSADFAIDKAAGQPCPNLGGDHRCTIHDRLRGSGFPGCAAYDCFGAGQRVVQVTLGGRPPEGARASADLLAAYGVVRDLHELLWYLADALARPAAQPVHAALQALFDDTDDLAGGDVTALAEVDAGRQRAAADRVLTRASALVRSGDSGRDLRRADLAGRDLAGADLRGADLRGAVLIGADLRGADLRRADLLGADLRAADLRGADLAESLYLTRTQVGSARGDRATVLPAGPGRPDNWLPGA